MSCSPSQRSGSDEYEKDMEHFIGSVGLPSICSVRPSTIEEVGEIVRLPICHFGRLLTIPKQLKIVGRDDVRCPFAVGPPNNSFSLSSNMK